MGLNKPDFSGLTQLDTAVMLEKYIMVNGMLHYGTKEEKARAKEELAELIPITSTHLNSAALQQAFNELSIEMEDFQAIKTSKLF